MKRIVFLAVCLVVGLASVPVHAAELTETQKAAIVDHCELIKEDLVQVQRLDSRARVYIGRYYETILSKFMTPLNLRLVENNISDTRLIESQTGFAERRQKFVTDYIAYQQSLEELIATNCSTEPQLFYDRLTEVREKREKVNQDTQKARKLITGHVLLVEELKEKL